MPSSNQPPRAYFVATVKVGTEHEVARKLCKLSDLNQIMVMYGLYDVIVGIEAPNLGQHDA